MFTNVQLIDLISFMILLTKLSILQSFALLLSRPMLLFGGYV